MLKIKYSLKYGVNLDPIKVRSAMKILESHLLKSVFTLSLSYLFIATLLSWTIEMLGKLDFLLSNTGSLFNAFYFSILYLPPTLVLMLPFAFLFSIVQILSSMNNNLEMVAIHASGSSATVLAKPILFLAFCFCLISFYLANFVTPQARMTMRNLVNDMNTNFIILALKEGKFHKLGQDIFISIDEKTKEGLFSNFFLIDQRDKNKAIYYFARYAYIAEQNQHRFLILRDGEVAHKNAKQATLSLLRFSYYSLNMSDLFSTNQTAQLYPKDRSFRFLWHPNPDDPYYKNSQKAYRAEFHKRLTEWLHPLIFALISLSFLSFPKSHRQSNLWASMGAIGFCLCYYFLNYFFLNRAQTEMIYIFYLYINLFVHLMLYSFLFYFRQNHKFFSIRLKMKKSFSSRNKTAKK